MNSTRLKAIAAAIVLLFLGLAAAGKLDPSRDVNWPTGSSGCVYAPGTNSCVVPSGASNVASNALFLWMGTSGNDDDGGFLGGNTLPITSWTTGSNKIVFTATNSFSVGQWINIGSLSGTPFGGGWEPFQVIATGLSSSQFEVTLTSASGSCSSSCGLIQVMTSVTSISQSGSTVTLTASNGFHTGDWVNMRFLQVNSTWPASAAPFVLGTGHTLFQVLSSGLSSSQFEVNVGSLTVSSCSSNCGAVETAMNNLPFRTAQEPGMPANAVSNTYVLLPTDPTLTSSAPSVASSAAHFAALVSGVPTGVPRYLIIDDSNNDTASCRTNAQTTSDYKTIFSDAHTDSMTVVAVSAGAVNFSNQSTGCTPPASEVWMLNQVTLPGMGPTTANASSGQFWDILSDAGSVYNDGFTTKIGGSFAGGWNLKAQRIAIDMLAGGGGSPLPKMPIMFSAPAFSLTNAINGYMFKSQGDTLCSFGFLSTSYTESLCIDTFDNNVRVNTVCIGPGFSGGQSNNAFGCGSNATSVLAGYLNYFQSVTIDGVINTSFPRSGLLCFDGGGSTQNCPIWLGTNGTTDPLELNGVQFEPNSGILMPSGQGIVVSTGGSANNVWNTNGATSTLTPTRAGAWTITSATSAAVTFTTSMGGTPDSCAVTPSSNPATTGNPWVTGLSSTGFTVDVASSGTISGTYQCTNNNSN